MDCPSSLIVMTDSIRLKQVVLNLVRNSSKFVERDFLCIWVKVEGPDCLVRLYIEDSGPGVPVEKSARSNTINGESPTAITLHQF